VIEDNSADVFLIREAIESVKLNAELNVLTDGEKAIRFLESADRDSSIEVPDVVILDINLPKKHGGDVLQSLRRSVRFGTAPVLIVTSSDSARDREAMIKLGANGYFRKPSAYLEFMKLGELVKSMLDAGAASLGS